MIISTKELAETANELYSRAREYGITLTGYQSMELAAKILHTDVIARCFGVHRDGNIQHPPFIERIAMDLGAANGETIKGALYELAENVLKQ